TPHSGMLHGGGRRRRQMFIKDRVGRWGRIFDLRAKPAIIPFEIKRYRLCAGLLIAFVYELAPAVLPIRGCLFFLIFVF
ncbi:hypothetical protein NVQ89_10230, partial [Neisseria gonorrhoeae]|uniref:hypothetical protein n=1 Tax=Neisseria gonorrhoeae TaxID=485 RepID=UPI002162E3B1